MFFVQKFIIIIFLLRSGVNKDSIPDYPLTDQCTYTNLFQKYFIFFSYFLVFFCIYEFFGVFFGIFWYFSQLGVAGEAKYRDSCKIGMKFGFSMLKM